MFKQLIVLNLIIRLDQLCYLHNLHIKFVGINTYRVIGKSTYSESKNKCINYIYSEDMWGYISQKPIYIPYNALSFQSDIKIPL